jgi:CspA family cold shock protein
MKMGSVKWFNDAKGFGFILSEDVDEDIFVHYSEIQQDGFKTLEAGESVEFELKQSPKGLRALNVVPEEEKRS